MNSKKCSYINFGKMLFTIFIFIFIYRNLKIGYAWSFSDLLPFNTYRDIDLLFGTWDFNLLGYPYVTSGTRIIPLILGMIIKNDIVFQNIYYMSSIPLSFMAMYLLSKRFISSYTGRFFASFLYALNPITIGEFFNGSTWMDTYALSPILILLIIKFLEYDNINIICGLTISILFGLIASNLWITFWTLLFPISLIISVELIKELRNQKCRIRVTYLFVFLLLGLLLLLPSIDYLFFVENTAFNEKSIESYFSEIRHNYEYAIPTNIAKMAGNAGSPMHYLGYDENNWWSIFGFVIPIFTIFSVIRTKRLSEHVYLISLLIIVIFTIIFMYATHEKYTYWLYDHAAFLFSLRNPKYLMYAFSLAMSVLFGLGCHTLINSFGRPKKNIISFLILLSLTIYLYPVWDGDMGLNKRVTEYAIPEYYYSTFNYMENNSKEHYRVLWLPYTYDVQTRLISNIDHVGIRQGQDLSQSPSYNSVHMLFLSIEHNETENIAQNLGFYNVKYIVIDKNYTPYKQKNAYALWTPKNIETYYQYRTPFIRGPPKKFIKYMSSIDGFEKIYDDKYIRIYYNHYFRPYIFMSNVSSENMSKIYENNTENFVRNNGRISFDINKTNEDSILILLESYDRNWNANIGNTKLEHSNVLGWANGFKVPTNLNGTLQIEYAPQKHRNTVMIIWIFIWIFVVISLIFLIYTHIRKNKK